MKMRKHRIKGVECMFVYTLRGNKYPCYTRVLAGNGYHRKTFDWENF